MFTLKLFRRQTNNDPRTLGPAPVFTGIFEAPRVEIAKIAEHTVEVRVLEDDGRWRRDSFYVGERTAEFNAIDDDNHYDWGLVENASGKTTEHIRPHSYG